MEQRPQEIHTYQTAVHDSFLRSLYYCANETGSYQNAEFTQCIKAAGINFKYSYDQFNSFKGHLIQIRAAGIKQ